MFVSKNRVSLLGSVQIRKLLSHTVSAQHKEAGFKKPKSTIEANSMKILYFNTETVNVEFMPLINFNLQLA